MNETRQAILDILRSRGEATIDQISNDLSRTTGKGISSVTVRYHLRILQDEGTVIQPRIVPRETRGRPQHVFKLARRALTSGNSAEVLSQMLVQLEQVGGSVAEDVLTETAKYLALSADIDPDASLISKLGAAESFLNLRGYDASVERVERGYILYTRSCPYHEAAQRSLSMCGFDIQLIESLIGQRVQQLMRLAGGDEACAYFIEEQIIAEKT